MKHKSILVLMLSMTIIINPIRVVEVKQLENEAKSITWTDKRIIEVESGQLSSGVLVETSTQTQEIWMWGDNYSGQIGNGTSNNNLPNPTLTDTSEMLSNPGDKIVSFSYDGNSAFTLVETSENTQEIWAWGSNFVGQLGTGTTIDQVSPKQIDTSIILDDPGDKITTIEAGAFHSGVIVEDIDNNQEIWLWGLNDHGQLGNGTQIDSLTPVLVDTSDMLNDVGDRIIEFNLGFKNSGVIVEDVTGQDQVWMWGEDFFGETSGDFPQGNVLIPTRVNLGLIIDAEYELSSLTTSMYNSGVIAHHETNPDYVLMWGNNEYGQIGIGTTSTTQGVTKVNLDEAIDDPNDTIASIDVSGGESVTMVINNADGTDELWTWGNNDFGQLGSGDNNNSSLPILIDTSNLLNQSGDKITSINNGNSHHNLALIQSLDGSQELWAWGQNSNGQLGNGSFIDSNVPLLIIETV